MPTETHLKYIAAHRIMYQEVVDDLSPPNMRLPQSNPMSCTSTRRPQANNPPSASPKHTAKRSRPINLDHVLFLGGVSPCNTGVDDLLGSAPAEHTPHHQPKPSLEADFTTMLNALVTTRERPSPNSVGKEAPGSPLPNSPLRQSPPRQSQRSTGSQPPAMLPPKPSPEPSAEQLPEEMHARWLQVLTAKKHALEQVQHMRAEALHALDSMRRMLIEATDRCVSAFVLKWE